MLSLLMCVTTCETIGQTTLVFYVVYDLCINEMSNVLTLCAILLFELHEFSARYEVYAVARAEQRFGILSRDPSHIDTVSSPLN